MRTPPPSVVAAGATVAVVVTLLAVFLLPPGPPGPPSSGSFNFSQGLPTGNATSNGQTQCGTNVTESLTLPSPAIVNYSIRVNSSVDSANIWIVGTGLNVFQASGSGGGTVGGSIGTGRAMQLEFFFQGCGPVNPVPFGFWGNYTATVLPY